MRDYIFCHCLTFIKQSETEKVSVSHSHILYGVGLWVLQSEVSCSIRATVLTLGDVEVEMLLPAKKNYLFFSVGVHTQIYYTISYHSPHSYNIYRTAAILAFLFHFSIESKVIPYDEGRLQRLESRDATSQLVICMM